MKRTLIYSLLDGLLCVVLATALLLTFAGIAAGCQGTDPAEVATYKAIAPEYRAYVEADESLTVAERERRLRTVDLWAEAVGLGAPSR